MNWNALRAQTGSQQGAFEEICCQLARFECPTAAHFVRKGTPDAGVECFWQFPNGDEAAWQAKFFPSSSETDWSQIDASIKTALDKHPRLVTYTICLPFDRPDARVEGQKSFLQRWDEHVIKWQGWARERGMEVEFTYWGDHELGLRLSREEHRGRVYYWFGEERLSMEWFKQRLEEVVAKAGDRYTPELDVRLPISWVFDALGRTSEWRMRLLERRGRIKDAINKSKFGLAVSVASAEFEALNRNGTELYELLTKTALNGQADSGDEPLCQPDGKLGQLDWAAITRVSDAMTQAAFICDERLREVESRAKNEQAERRRALELDPQTSDVQPSQTELGKIGQPDREVDFGYSRHFLRQLRGELAQLLEWLEGDEVACANSAALMLCGEAGRGKTHLFCDVAERRVANGLPTVLLLAQDFGSGEPWAQVIAHLGLNCTADEFLGALDAAGEALGERALLMIDALNESTDKSLWRRNLAGILTKTARYPYVALALSVRSSYTDLVVPQSLNDEKLTRVTHEGFAGHEHRAATRFFASYGLQAPSVPLLTPEFSAPLFLKLFCEGLKKKGLSQVPRGLRGRTTIFRFLVDAINNRLSAPEFLDYDRRRNLIEESLSALARQMSEKGRAWLTPVEAQAVTSAFFTTTGYENSLYRYLISESLLNEDNLLLQFEELSLLNLSDEGQEENQGGHRNIEVVRFAYEKMADHFAAEQLLAQVATNAMSLEQMFGPEGPLASIRADGVEIYRRAGLLESLAVLLPESAARELPDLLPEIKEEYPMRTAFLESLLWRRQDAFTERTLELVNELLLSDGNFTPRFYGVWLTLASLPDHPYNADLLHENLLGKQIPERDSFWSIWLHEEYGDEASPVRRLVEWAWSEDDKTPIEDEAVRLCAMALAWMLSTPNRYLRDRATKALVMLLQDRLAVLARWLEQFWTVNDPYVLERVLAVTYGCIVRSAPHEAGIVPVAQQVYDRIFANGRPPFHLLLRDYARNIVEVALRRGLDVAVDEGKLRPPYGDVAESVWPDMPSEADIEALREPTEDDLPSAINPHTGNPKSQAWRDSEREQAKRGRGTIFFSTADWGDFHRYVIETRGGDYRWSGRPLDDPAHLEGQNVRFDHKASARWIAKRVFELGWTYQLFGLFDSYAGRPSDTRSAHKAERMGKKYQWLAFHELMARQSDTFYMRSELGRMDGRLDVYRGPWQCSCRDIDPSWMRTGTGWQAFDDHIVRWWSPVDYDAWAKEADSTIWLQDTQDLPELSSLVEVVRPEDNSQWLVLDTSALYHEPIPPGEDRHEITRREFQFWLQAYIVPSAKLSLWWGWAQKQRFTGDWMPSSPTLYKLCWGEHYNSPAYDDHDNSYHGLGWTEDPELYQQMPCKVLVASQHHFIESSDFDCSVDENMKVAMPSGWIARKAGWRTARQEGMVLDASGQVVAFDPSVEQRGPGTLLIRREVMEAFLQEHDLTLVWTLAGEKRVHGPLFSNYYVGHLSISGIAQWDGTNNIETQMNGQFESPRS